MTKTRQEILKNRYGFSSGSYDYVPKGAEILKYIGQTVIKVDYDKEENGTWKTKQSPVLIISISDFDPLNMTYLCKYKVEGGAEEEFRMIPEGYSWAESEDVTHVMRILPTSMHCKLMEDELFYSRLSDLWKKRDTLDFTALIGLASSKDKETTLRYSHHLACLIKLEEEKDEVLYFRIHKLNLKHKAGKEYALSIWDGNENPIKALVTSDQKEYDFELGIGKFKIIDLC